jgi:hypothetical protein
MIQPSIRDDLKNASISIKAGTSFIADQRLKTLLESAQSCLCL